MLVGVKAFYPRPLSPAAAVPNACMSLTALWSNHSSRAVHSPVNTEGDVAADGPSGSTELSSTRENRKRPAVLEVPQQNKIPRRTPNSFPTGATDLGAGSSVIFQPNAFNLSDSRRLYRALKVCKQRAFVSWAALLSPYISFFSQHLPCSAVCVSLSDTGPSQVATQRSCHLWEESDAATSGGIYGKQYQSVLHLLTHKTAARRVDSTCSTDQGILVVRLMFIPGRTCSCSQQHNCL